MKKKSKISGEIYEIDIINITKDRIVGIATHEDSIRCKFDYSLDRFNEEWEDYEEPKEWWYIDVHGPHKVTNNDEYYQQVKAASKEIGNYFEIEEEAEKAVEKLKAWKRLKDKGFKFEGIKQDYTRFNQQEPMRTGRKYLQFNKSEDEEWMKENWEDLGLLFGGEDE